MISWTKLKTTVIRNRVVLIEMRNPTEFYGRLARNVAHGRERHNDCDVINTGVIFIIFWLLYILEL